MIRIARYSTLYLCMAVWTVGLSGQAIYKKIPLSLPLNGIQDWQAVLMPYYPALSQTGVSLELAHRIQSPGGLHLTFDQHYQGIPIYGAGIKINLDNAGRVVSCLSTLKSFERIETIHTNHSKTSEYQGVACYFWKEGLLRAAKRYRYNHIEQGQSLEVVLDEYTGSTLHKEDRSAYFNPPDTAGRARVFLPDPCTRAQQPYGVLFEDNNDLHTSVFDRLMDTVVLRDLTMKGDTFMLEGPYVRIEDITPNYIPPAYSLTGDFFYQRSESGFEDVMAYYHIDTFQRYVQSLGFPDLHNYPIRVDTHGFGKSDQSQFVPDGINSYLKFGEGGVDDAEDADVIIHEYTHALSYAAAPETMSGCERRGLDEGYADYFAAAYSKDLSLYDWENIYNWDGHNPFYKGRTVNSPQLYPLAFCNLANINDWGEVWATTLMQIRDKIGAKAADKLVLQALYGSFQQMTFSDAVQILLDADSVLYQKKYADDIRFFACGQNILMSASCISVANQKPYDGGEWDILPSTSPGIWYLSGWEKMRQKNLTLRVYDLQGRMLASYSNITPEKNTFQIKQSFENKICLFQVIGQNRYLGLRRIFISRI